MKTLERRDGHECFLSRPSQANAGVVDASSLQIWHKNACMNLDRFG